MKTENKLYKTGTPEMKEAYKAPVIEIVEVKVEQGFQTSPPDPGDIPEQQPI